MTLVKVAETSEIPLGQMKVFKSAEKQVLIANVNGVYYAIGNVCTHMGGDLSKGTLEGSIVTCPRHKAKFYSARARKRYSTNFRKSSEM